MIVWYFPYAHTYQPKTIGKGSNPKNGSAHNISQNMHYKSSNRKGFVNMNISSKGNGNFWVHGTSNSNMMIKVKEEFVMQIRNDLL